MIKFGYNEHESDAFNMQKYIEFRLNNSETIRPYFSYESFVKYYRNKDNVVFIRYEDLENDSTLEI